MDISSGAWARYDMLSSREYMPPPLTELVLLVGPTEGEYRWWEVTAVKLDGSRFAIRLLSESIPMIGTENAVGTIQSYILRENEDHPLEYIDPLTSIAFLPKFDFVDHLIPRSIAYSAVDQGFATTGTCLGHVLSMIETGTDGEWSEWDSPDTLLLNPDEIHFKSRMIRDEEGEYIAEGDYTYVPLTQEDLHEMIDVGLNGLLVGDEQEEWIYRRPVFYYKRFRENSRLNYPEILYRSNFRGASEYIDEPEVHILRDRDDLNKIKRPEEGGYLISQRVEEIWNHPSPGERRRSLIREQLRARGANVGTMTLDDDDHPLWVTMHETSFYQLQGGTAGVVHQGRYQVEKFINDSVKFIGKGLEISPRELLLVEYAYLRGAARAFGTDWGMSIYGQCDPEIAPDAITLAYDMGARWIWFWSSDHQHHLPHFMKLKLLSHLQEHKKSNPRGSLEELLYAPRTAIVLPYGYGYFLQFYNMWEARNLNIKFKNELGVAYRDVFAAALVEAIACAKAGEDFDITVDAGQDFDGYTRLIRVGIDGLVSDTNETPNATSTIRLLDAETVDFPGRVEPPLFSIPYRQGISIDGDLSKWPEDAWIDITREDLYIEAHGPGDKPVWGGPSDLSAEVTFAYDEDYFYVASRVTDDVYSQADRIADSWNADSIQFGLDFWLDRDTGFEFNFADALIAMTPDGPQAFLCQNDRGMDIGVIEDAVIHIEPRDGYMIYEAAIPRQRYTILPPQLVQNVGVRFRANDADGDGRKGWLGLSDTAVVTDELTEFVPASIEPPPYASEYDAAIVVDETVRIMSDGEHLKLVLVAYMPEEESASVEVSLERNGFMAASGNFDVDLPSGLHRRQLLMSAGRIAPGTYTVRTTISTKDGVVAEATYPVYIGMSRLRESDIMGTEYGTKGWS